MIKSKHYDRLTSTMWDFAGNFTTQLDTLNAVSTERKYLSHYTARSSERVRESTKIEVFSSSSTQFSVDIEVIVKSGFHSIFAFVPFCPLHSELGRNPFKHSLTLTVHSAIGYLSGASHNWPFDGILDRDIGRHNCRHKAHCAHRTQHQHRRSQSLHRKICIQAARFINNNTTATGLKWSWNAYSRKVNLWV